MNWNNQEIETIGDLGDVMCDIFERGNPEEAQAFMRAYRAENENADANVGYMTGYYTQDGQAMREFFGTAHPVFGMTIHQPEETAVSKQITHDDIADAMAEVTSFSPDEDYGHNSFMEAHGLDMDVLNEVADEGYMLLQFLGSTGDELARELFRGGFLSGLVIGKKMVEETLDPEDADRIATGRGGHD